MRKYIVGFVVGMAVTVAGSAYADDITQSIIGKKIDGEFPIKVAGKKLNTNAAVIEGTSYLPVRAIGEALNMDVSFNADMGIELIEKGDTKVTETQPTTTPSTGPSKEWKIEDLQSKLKIAKTSLSYVEQDIKEFPTAENQKTIDRLKIQIADYEAQIAALEAQQ